jgi:hypothetical protein
VWSTVQPPQNTPLIKPAVPPSIEISSSEVAPPKSQSPPPTTTETDSGQSIDSEEKSFSERSEDAFTPILTPLQTPNFSPTATPPPTPVSPSPVVPMKIKAIEIETSVPVEVVVPPISILPHQHEELNLEQVLNETSITELPIKKVFFSQKEMILSTHNEMKNHDKLDILKEIQRTTKRGQVLNYKPLTKLSERIEIEKTKRHVGIPTVLAVKIRNENFRFFFFGWWFFFFF